MCSVPSGRRRWVDGWSWVYLVRDVCCIVGKQTQPNKQRTHKADDTKWKGRDKEDNKGGTERGDKTMNTV